MAGIILHLVLIGEALVRGDGQLGVRYRRFARGVGRSELALGIGQRCLRLLELQGVLLALGASRVDIGQGEQSWVVLADPEGNEFCVLGERMGAVHESD